jgi:hypothetical protein
LGREGRENIQPNGQDFNSLERGHGDRITKDKTGEISILHQENVSKNLVGKFL